MKAFAAYWNNRLEQDGPVSASEIWRAALEWLLTKRGHMIVDFNKEYLNTSVIHEELSDE